MVKEDKLRLGVNTASSLAPSPAYWTTRYKKTLQQLFLFNQEHEGWEAERLGMTMTGGEREGEAK